MGYDGEEGQSLELTTRSSLEYEVLATLLVAASTSHRQTLYVQCTHFIPEFARSASGAEIDTLSWI